MGRGKSTEHGLRRAIIKSHKLGRSARTISRETHVPRTTVQQIIQTYLATGSIAPKPIQGRPRTTSSRDDRHLRRLAKKNRRQTVAEINRAWSSWTCRRRTSEKTGCRRRLHELGMDWPVAEGQSS